MFPHAFHENRHAFPAVAEMLPSVLRSAAVLSAFLHKSAGFRLHVCPCTEHTRERSCTAADQILYGMGIGFTLQNVENGIGQLFSLLRFHAQDPLPQRGIQQLTGVGGILGIVPVIPDHTPRVWIVLQKPFCVL